MIERVRHRVVQSVLILHPDTGIDTIQRFGEVLVSEIPEVRDGCYKLPWKLVLNRQIQAVVVSLLEELGIPDQISSSPAQVRTDAFTQWRNQGIGCRIRIRKRRLRHAVQ